MAPIDNRIPTLSELRWFGVIVAVAFVVVGAVVGWRLDASGLRSVLWCVGVAVALLYYAIPSLRVPFYMVWMTLFAPIGAAVSMLLLGFIYFAVLTPIAIVMAVFGRDRLGKRFDPRRTTYWTPHDSSGDLDRYFRQT
jgi:hypothetical protein